MVHILPNAEKMGQQTKSSTFLKTSVNNKVILCNLFYDAQSKFQNKDLLTKKDMQCPFFNFHEHIFGSTSIIQTLNDLDKELLSIKLN
jgi:hypothetical protein